MSGRVGSANAHDLRSTTGTQDNDAPLAQPAADMPRAAKKVGRTSSAETRSLGAELRGRTLSAMPREVIHNVLGPEPDIRMLHALGSTNRYLRQATLGHIDYATAEQGGRQAFEALDELKSIANETAQLQAVDTTFVATDPQSIISPVRADAEVMRLQIEAGAVHARLLPNFHHLNDRERAEYAADVFAAVSQPDKMASQSMTKRFVISENIALFPAESRDPFIASVVDGVGQQATDFGSLLVGAHLYVGLQALAPEQCMALRRNLRAKLVALMEDPPAPAPMPPIFAFMTQLDAMRTDDTISNVTKIMLGTDHWSGFDQDFRGAILAWCQQRPAFRAMQQSLPANMQSHFHANGLLDGLAKEAAAMDPAERRQLVGVMLSRREECPDGLLTLWQLGSVLDDDLQDAIAPHIPPQV